MSRRVTITPPGAGAEEVVIYDETTNDLPDYCQNGFTPKVTRLPQITPLVNSPFQFAADRANVVLRWTPVVAHTFDTQLDAQDFIGARATKLPGAGELKITLVSLEGSNDRFYSTALLESAECVTDSGLTVIYRYSLIFNCAYSEKP